MLIRPLYQDRPVDCADHEDYDGKRVRTQIENPVVRFLVAPANLGPSYLTNFVAGLEPTKHWPIQYFALPVTSLYFALLDSWHGYPFWQPSAQVVNK